MSPKRWFTCWCVLAAACFAAAAFAQELTISGSVRDLKTRQGIGGVSIQIKGAQLGTTNDLDGRYSLRIPGASRQMLVVLQHRAYEAREILLDSLLFKNVVFMWPPGTSMQDPGLAQEHELTISGIIRDRNTYREIRDVNIYVKGTQIGTSSDYAGRYSLRIRGATRKMVVVFGHVGYEPREVPLDSVAAMRYVSLQPRVITMPGMVIEERGIQPVEIVRDLPQSVSLLESKNFEIRGFIDAGDLLRTDQSVQVQEELSGKKTVAIRGGNPDEVVVLYNGIKLNSSFDNVFDLSLIDLEDIERFEIIKGSNTALYGPEAFSGVINIVPKVQQDYNVRFQQRLGTYRSGNWGLHLYHKLGGMQGSYSFKRGGSKRSFVDVTDEGQGLENVSQHHTANLSYNFSEGSGGRPGNSLSAMYVHTSLEYDNRRDNESLSNFNEMLSLKYAGDVSVLRDLDLSVSLRRLEEEQSLASGSAALDRSINEQAIHANAEKRLAVGPVELLLAYQFQRAELDFTDTRKNFQEQPVGLVSAQLQRQHHGLVSIAKLRGETGGNVLQNIDMDVSVRHDVVRDEQTDVLLRSGVPSSGQQNPAGTFNENNWQETMFKFALSFTGSRKDFAFSSYLNFGSNTKFPTLFQQVSAPLALTERAFQPNLSPEKNRSTELGAVITKDVRGPTAIYGWQVSGNFFQNHYDNKFRISSTPGVPIAFYDNVQNARISGLETKSSVFLFHKKVTLEAGLSRYFISEKAAFPFKADFKRTLNLIVDHAGYSLQLLWFKEGEQAGWLRQQNGRFAEIILPHYANLDAHLSKTFAVGRLKVFANASGRNLLHGNDVVLQGLAIRDRRFYLTVGAQY